MKTIYSLIILIFILSSCSSMNNTKNQNLPNIILKTDNNKYDLIMKKTFYKFYKNSDNKNKTIIIKSQLSFQINDILSIKGKRKLKKLNGILSYEMTKNGDAKVIKAGTIRSSINYGNVTSLYGIDKSLLFAKERLSRHLAQKLYNSLILRVNKFDN